MERLSWLKTSYIFSLGDNYNKSSVVDLFLLAFILSKTKFTSWNL